MQPPSIGVKGSLQHLARDTLSLIWGHRHTRLGTAVLGHRLDLISWRSPGLTDNDSVILPWAMERGPGLAGPSQPQMSAAEHFLQAHQEESQLFWASTGSTSSALASVPRETERAVSIPQELGAAGCHGPTSEHHFNPRAKGNLEA